jgi:hypothetical protein
MLKANRNRQLVAGGSGEDRAERKERNHADY